MGIPKTNKSKLSSENPLPGSADLVIVGAGIIGLSIAYNLAKRGFGNIVLIEKGYLASGASGRNGGGIRQQWSTEINVRLMQQSVAICRRFAKELGVNIWFRQGGYLFLSRSEKETARLEENVALQNRCGVPTRILTTSEASKLVPELDPSGFHAASYNPTDGILFPWPFLWGYAQGAVDRGANLFTFTTVTGIDTIGEREYHVHTNRGTVRTSRVLNAAGAWSPHLAEMVGVTLPDLPVRHEICSSEPLKPFLRPMVSVLSTGLYFSQSMRGEIVGGVTLRGDPPTLQMGSTLRFLATYAKQICKVMPCLSELKILRQWAGPYDVTIDGNPILGEPVDRPGFYLCCGFMGHGFMMAPIIGELYAEWLTGGQRHQLFEQCRLDRFSGQSPGNLRHEDFIIG